MFHQMDMGAVWCLIICLVTLQIGSYASTNVSTLNTVLMREIASTSLKDLLSYEELTASNLSSSCFKDNESIIEACLVNQCLSGQVIADLYGVSLSDPLGEEALTEVAPAVLYSLQQRSSCVSSDSMTLSSKPSAASAWGYGFLFVTLINLCSLTGIIVLPCMKTAVYSVILMFMVALAVGTLVGSGVLVLIPEAFELVHVGGGGESGHSYIWTSTSIIGGIYLFFLIERVMRIINVWRENTKEKKCQDELATRGTLTSSFTRKTPPVANLDLKNPAHLQLAQSSSAKCLCSMDVVSSPDQDNNAHSSSSARDGGSGSEGGESASATPNSLEEAEGEMRRDDESNAETTGVLIKKPKGIMNGHGHSHHARRGDGTRVAPVAYMVIFGDGLHNFIDGLSIGAAFTDSVLLGISVSVAVICEELPHELGDFAILLNAGMRLRRALMYNFLSSLMCYFGLVLGILVGENTTAHTWIFGVAGGMFLYIALVDMMPEMNSASESEEGRKFGVAKTFLVQNLGLISGYSIILLLSLYGDVFDFGQ
ncbi:metal cation symporter ZIP8-like [Babylonia areolata]|uniref:metal cation symporter ZIP8-like n=1 Tax=Babylonia areolata TaxID=304850 RepID=UPI003FCF81FA